VGFAPVKPGSEDYLIQLMEGVEDIPGTALHDGIDFDWESFPEYLDAIDKKEFVVDVGAMIGHGPVRSYVMGYDRCQGKDDASEEEIKGVIEQGLEDNAIEKQESKLVHGALNFDDIVIRSVMTPRTKMFTLNSKMLLFEALPLINKSGFSRIPLYGKNHDEITGIVNVRDILKYLEIDEKMVDLQQLARKPIFVSQEKKVSDLLKEMQGRKAHMAIVLDEFEGVEGCVTLEDLVEEIVGEIHDETDVAKSIFKKKVMM